MPTFMPAAAIRPAQPDDITAITRIYTHAVQHGTASFELEPPGDMPPRADVLIAGQFPYLVAERDGAVAGYAYAGPYRARPAYRFTLEDSVYIAPHAAARHRPSPARSTDRRVGGARLSPDDRRHRRLRTVGIDRTPRRCLFSIDRNIRCGWLQIWPLARQRLDAARAWPGREDSACVL